MKEQLSVQPMDVLMFEPQLHLLDLTVLGLHESLLKSVNTSQLICSDCTGMNIQ